MSVQQTMMMVTSLWGEKKSFRLIPVTNDSPYSEGIYDPENKVLAMMSSIIKEGLHTLPRLDDNGDPIVVKTKRMNGKNYKEQRIQLETFTEYYITEKDEIDQFLKLITINADTFNYKLYTEASILIPETPKIITNI